MSITFNFIYYKTDSVYLTYMKSEKYEISGILFVEGVTDKILFSDFKCETKVF